MPRNWYECCHERSWNHLLSGRIWIQKRPFKYGEEDSLENNDAVLIRMAQNGDYRSIESLHDRYRPSIYSYFYYRVAEVATAEDLTSEVFVRMVEKIDTYEPCGRPFLSWLYTIANNLRVDHFRQTNRQPLSQLSESLPAVQSTPPSSTELRLWEECFRSALLCLTEDQRLVIIGKFIEERTNEEMAAVLQKPEGAIKSLQHRALAALRKEIERTGCYEL
jgi:RNA polymerase sigma-70 factor (ECF subfamily)